MIAAGLLALALAAMGPEAASWGEGSGEPTSIGQDLARADSAYVAGHDEDARSGYRQVLRRDSLSVRANHRLALLLSRVDQGDSALILVARARAIEPNDPGLLETEARLLSWAGRLGESIADYDALLALEPHHRTAQLARARVLGWAGRYASAESTYAAMLEADPRDVGAMTGRAQNAEWRGQSSAAEAGYLAAVRLDADNVDALIGLARLLHGQGRQGPASIQLSRVLTLEPGSRAANDLRREIRAAQRPQVDLGFGVSRDSDDNVGWSRTFSTSLAVGDGLRAFLSGGSLAVTDPTRDALRTLGEFGLRGSHGRTEATIAVGARWLNPSTGSDRSMASYRSSLSYRFRDRLTAGAGFARYAMDETAVLIGSGLEVDELHAGLDADVGSGIALSAATSRARLSDGNHRASGLIALMHPLGSRASLGVLGRVLSYEFHGSGYFSPDRFALGEARGTLALTRRAWSGRLNGGLGAQQVGAGAAGQLAWRAAGQLQYGWAAINQVEASFGASNSAASSTTGAFRYVTASLAVRLGL